VKRLTLAAQKVAAGDLEPRIEVKSQDEIGQLAVAFNQMAGALARDRELRRNLIADVTHELRTPLSVLQGNLEAMLDGVLPTNPEEIASLRDETALLARLVSDLSMLSLAEAGQLKLERIPTDLGALISRSIEPLRLQAESQGINLTAEISPGLPLTNVDSDRIEQVVRNLVGNALRYTPGGGSITVRANPGASGFIQVQVQDTGTGITKEDLPYVFDRFYRAEKSRNRSSGGSGIGLAIVKQLVEAHGGKVWAESAPGKGAVFSFSLPHSSSQAHFN
jgi:signal transduction histidine kinase